MFDEDRTSQTNGAPRFSLFHVDRPSMGDEDRGITVVVKYGTNVPSFYTRMNWKTRVSSTSLELPLPFDSRAKVPCLTRTQVRRRPRHHTHLLGGGGRGGGGEGLAAVLQRMPSTMGPVHRLVRTLSGVMASSSAYPQMANE